MSGSTPSEWFEGLAWPELVWPIIRADGALRQSLWAAWAMSKLRFRISMSRDGFAAGLSQSVDNPLGIGGMRLHEGDRGSWLRAYD